MKVNNTYYKVIEVEKVCLDTNDLEFAGSCNTKQEIIEILSCLSKTKKKSTLIHELTHAYMFENGHTKDEFSEEEVCNLFGAYAEAIINTTYEYLTEEIIAEFHRETERVDETRQ